jgi:hypothetical protein
MRAKARANAQRAQVRGKRPAQMTLNAPAVLTATVL